MNDCIYSSESAFDLASHYCNKMYFLSYKQYYVDNFILSMFDCHDYLFSHLISI